MIQLLKLLKSFVFGRSWVLILILGLSSATAAGTASWKLKDLIDSQKYSVLNSEYQNYKLTVSNSINQENTAVINKMSSLLDNLKGLQADFKKKADKDREFSESLKKELYDQNGKSCPLSPAVEHYLDRLRIDQQNRRTN